jgi:hypothetical protein
MPIVIHQTNQYGLERLTMMPVMTGCSPVLRLWLIQKGCNVLTSYNSIPHVDKHETPQKGDNGKHHWIIQELATPNTIRARRTNSRMP